jgi:hypothetical protein
MTRAASDPREGPGPGVLLGAMRLEMLDMSSPTSSAGAT